ncbi:MAG: bifunctional diaminohydroxyphosphoribosylaminopyrimidine deaminase/5-amino-6-(5-phosphoribosylamino)uracil reductase RibD [Pseudomonadota bacterium]|nr:bifunctional diaminohydroxyphosphoribosylaminopyrimidine deaminase/5-amino-6-(5-phosphoribosylamino)uracil reductase RibD [Pseudomonadota bacterium]MEE2748697.1 bifunctional diaminohydroxyphosphoribosylaminopyrimidine deaminase/5-amino-6-(5-phosphoribosylamino)uracil reductase RibD [Pseudomonadota bacterium]
MSVATVADRQWMAAALKLAAQGMYSTSPNPRVGCILVKDGEAIGEGWHQKAGEPHAEVLALRAAGDNARGATAYVTLEPCSHYGRTPPCAEGLIKAGVSRVVAAVCDPNPDVAGRGFQMLREAGIEVVESCLEDQATAINEGFMKRMRTGLPLVRMKLAMSLDGRTAMASGQSQWITGPEARRDVQRLRAQSCAVITGADSVLIDNPSMTVRAEEAGLTIPVDLQRQPLRVIVDGEHRVNASANIFAQAGDILIASRTAPTTPVERDADSGNLTYWAGEKSDRTDLSGLLRHLAEQGHNEILVESGAQLAGAFVRAGLVDELIVYCAPTILGSDARPLLSLPIGDMAAQIRWRWQDVRMVGNDLRLTMRPELQSSPDKA